MPSLDTLVIPQPDGSLTTTVYRKPNQTDQYLHWDSYHSISAKYIVVSKLHHGVKAVGFTTQHLQIEEHLQKSCPDAYILCGL